MADETQDPIDRLAAADPAAGAPDPDVAAIRAAVLAEPASNVVPMRGRRTAYAVGGIAAGVVLLAGTAFAGVAVGRGTAPQPEAVTAAAPVEETLPVVGVASPPLPTVAGQSAPAVPGTGNGMGMAGAPVAESMSADKSMIYPGYGVTLVPAEDLVDDAGTAVGYRLDAAGVDQEALARQLAAAFAIGGEPQRQDYGWAVGAIDGSGPSIWIGDDPTVSWSYSNPTIDPWSCGVTTAEEPVAGDAESSPAVAPAQPENCDPATEPISDRDAVRAARKLLAAVGVSDDPAGGIDIEWEAGSDEYTTWVTGWQRIDGQRTQLAWSFTFAGEDVVWANGFAAGLEPVPAYPIVGAKTAVLRSSDPRFTSFGPTPLDYGIAVPMAEARGTASSDVAATDGASAPAVPAGDPGLVQVWWDPATVVGAEQTLAQYWQPDGTMLILPAYRLTTADDRGTWAVIAIDESAVEFVAATP